MVHTAVLLNIPVSWEVFLCHGVSGSWHLKEP